MDEAALHRWQLVLGWLGENPGRDVLVCCTHATPLPTGRTPARTPEVLEAVHPVIVRLEGCANDVPPWALVDLAIAGGATVLVDTGTCMAPDVAALERLETLTGARVRRGAIGAEPPAVTLSLAHPPVSRRALLRRHDETGVPVAVAHVVDDPAQRLVESLRALGAGGGAGGAAGLSRQASPATRLEVSGCIACGVCVRACPHDALELRTASGTSTLVQHPDRCQGDLACVTHCPSDAVTAAGTLDWGVVLAGRPLPLARLATTACSRCGDRIPDGRTLCEACARREAEPFGWHVPEHLRDKLSPEWQRKLRGRAGMN
ncbi:4Fe-4S dicluster domain-containing protein [Propionibacteriaceae bacterium G1746]|uniref:4Fe-4S dicluster domain-containing protein n=1 Tax=Aestuariimicrobium sp. G57 TaxID=3418485 RepID=UPI003C29FD2A